MMKNIGISKDEWNALSAGRTVTIDRVEGDRKDEFKPGDKLAVHAIYQDKTAEVTIGRVVSYKPENVFTLEVSGFRMITAQAYSGGRSGRTS